MAIAFDDILNNSYAPGKSNGLLYKPQYKLVPKVQSISWGDPTDLDAADFQYEVVRVPVGTPFVGRGNHPFYQPDRVDMRIGCTMELVSVLAGERWTDHPQTAPRELTQAMILVNDKLPDHQRQRMLELVPRLVGTNTNTYGFNGNWDEDFEHLLNRVVQYAWRLRPEAVNGEIEYVLRSAHNLLDMFDQRTGRPTRKLDEQVLTRLMTALAA